MASAAAMPPSVIMSAKNRRRSAAVGLREERGRFANEQQVVHREREKRWHTYTMSALSGGNGYKKKTIVANVK